MNTTVPRLLLTLIAVCLAATAWGHPQAKVTAQEGLNMRRSPTASAAKLRVLARGEIVEVLGTNRRGSWRRVRTRQGKVGWVFGRYLEATTASPRPARGVAGALEDGHVERRAPARARGSTAAASAAAPHGGSVDRRNFSGLQPAFRKKVERVLRAMQAKGWQPWVAEGRRTVAQQREKVRLGYSRTMNSLHLQGLAADIVDRRYGWQGPAADLSFEFWKDLGAAARAAGLGWGGNWRSFKDVAHVYSR